MSDLMNEPTFTLGAVARQEGLSNAAIVYAVERGKLAVVTVNGCRRVTRSEAARYHRERISKSGNPGVTRHWHEYQGVAAEHGWHREERIGPKSRYARPWRLCAGSPLCS
jgi:hypothetical protein